MRDARWIVSDDTDIGGWGIGQLMFPWLLIQYMCLATTFLSQLVQEILNNQGLERRWRSLV